MKPLYSLVDPRVVSNWAGEKALEKGFAANTGDIRPEAVHLGAGGKE